MRYAKITDRLQGLGSEKWAVHIEGKRRQASGRDMIMLSIGEPDFHPPASLVGMIDERIRAGRTRYSNGRGEPHVLEAIAAYYTKRSGHRVAPDQVTFLPGTQTALFAAMMTIAEDGCDILMPDPYYATYEGVIAASGAKFVPIRTLPEDGFHLTATELRRHVTSNARALLLNTPNNPTGAVLSAKEISAIGQVCREHDLWILCDEVYSDLTFDAAFASPFDNPDLRDRTIVVSSLSKSHAMPGFRCGWAVGSQVFSDRLLPLAETMLFGSQPFLEDATAHALTHHFPEVDQMREAYRSRARTFVSGLSNAPGIVARMPEGGMFIMVDVRRTGLSGEDFATRLLDEENVVTMPGESFGEGGAGHVRVALTVDETALSEAATRMVNLARRLH